MQNLDEKPSECGMDSHLPRLKEWLDFHMMVGIEHFYIYDNSMNASAEVWEIVRPYAEKGYATYHSWPYKVSFHYYYFFQMIRCFFEGVLFGWGGGGLRFELFEGPLLVMSYEPSLLPVRVFF